MSNILRFNNNETKKVYRDYSGTEKGVIRVIYKTQKKSNIARGFGEIPYSKPELAIWLYSNGFKHLYDDWKASGMQKDKKPSVDRIDTNKGYSFENIRLVTWLENRTSQYRDIRLGVGTSGKRCKRLMKIKDEKVVFIYASYNSAVRHVGYSVEHQIKHNTTCRNNFKWKYAGARA